jgi:hypothetical protein
MARRSPSTPPHVTARGAVAGPTPLWPRISADRRPVGLVERVSTGLTLFVALSGVACGRTDIDFGDGVGGDATAIDYRREVVLVDANVVLVELVAPAADEARHELEALDDGVPLEEVVESVVPDGSAELVYDTTEAPPCMHVFSDGVLRGLIWL